MLDYILNNNKLLIGCNGLISDEEINKLDSFINRYESQIDIVHIHDKCDDLFKLTDYLDFMRLKYIFRFNDKWCI
jgi:hypothetical protein